ncbi:MAG: lipocalin-like domain-containing protein [Gammaproteobacteria bacterium]|nr:lipocalin-like domain-containing protein [Gammaproteobacteria bacterium]
MRLVRRLTHLLLAAALAFAPALGAQEGGGFRLGELLGGDGAGFARALEPRPFRFPADHGPHPDYRSEWWYFTGNLRTAGGRHFGYQLTFFRFALRPDPPVRDTAWAANQVYMAHFTLTDTEGGRFHAFERMSRDSLGLAGARSQPFAVWLRDWRAEGRAAALFPLRISVAEEGIALDLTLEGGKPWVLQGDRGLSRKSAAAGNASYYYSGTRIASRGLVRLAGVDYPVSGSSWFDREWSTSALGAGQVGWDWFALQLDDGSDLMYYRLRRADGSTDPHSAGILVDGEGRTTRLAHDAVRLEAGREWTSPATGAVYPVGWKLSVPALELSLEIAPRLPDQELDLSVRYWEGAVGVDGERDGRALGGVGYVELTGYGG